MPHRWCNSASLRREQIESGVDLTFNEVFKPLFVEHITNLNPQTIIEIGAGTGHLSKELSGKEYSIRAIEPSKGMYEVASEVLTNTDVNLINCTSFQLTNKEEFDVAFSHLVAHVVDDLLLFFKSVSSNLKSGSHFIFSIPHPCFYNEYKKFFKTEYNYMVPMKKFRRNTGKSGNIQDIVFLYVKRFNTIIDASIDYSLN